MHPLQELATALADVRDVTELATALTDALLRLVPGISASYNELHVATGRAYARIAPVPRDDWWARFQPVFETHMHENPLLAELARAGTLRASTWTDVDPDGRFRSTTLFREFYLPLGIETQLVVAATDPDGTVVGMAVNRGRAGFDDHDRAVLDAALPFALLARRAIAIEAERRALQAVLEGDGWRLERIAAAADPVVDAALREVRHRDGEVAGTVNLARAIDPATGRHVVVVGSPLPPHLVLCRDTTVAGRAVLRSLGLSARQSDVAVLLAQGATNTEIATELGIAPATVKKHLESIYSVLGARHRAGAVASLAAAGAVPSETEVDRGAVTPGVGGGRSPSDAQSAATMPGSGSVPPW